ncbi:MAG: tRNA (N6-isopentenyl adenosine(37)-C2)-methylthiotransferase MiaB [Minisyncoccia bacterium]
MTKTYFIITFGCQMNKNDSERIASFFEKIGYKMAAKIEDANFILVNMCSVRQSAVDRVYGIINKIEKLKKINPKIKTILTGCILNEDKNKLKNKFDFILNIQTLPKWKNIILKNKNFYQKIKDIKKESCEYFKIKPKYSNNFSAFVPISNGCNNFCSYCVVPFTRGKLICRNWKEIKKEVEDLVKNNFKEIWLLGQNVNDYQFKDVNFAKLLKIINNIEGNFWIRFTSPHPKNFTKELIFQMAKAEKVTPYLNLPIQSGDDEILKKMHRFYTQKEYENLVKEIRKAFKKYRKGLEKEVSISTDVIVGFPGETEKQFQNTVKIFKKIKFDMAYIAKFSKRSQTLAWKLKDDVSQKEKEKRYNILTNILKKTAKEKNKIFFKKEVDVLVDKVKKENSWFWCYGKSRHYKTCKFKCKENLLGNFVKIKIESVNSFGLFGKITK